LLQNLDLQEHDPQLERRKSQIIVGTYWNEVVSSHVRPFTLLLLQGCHFVTPHVLYSEDLPIGKDTIVGFRLVHFVKAMSLSLLVCQNVRAGFLFRSFQWLWWVGKITFK
jgi:hypothetical protein